MTVSKRFFERHAPASAEQAMAQDQKWPWAIFLLGRWAWDSFRVCLGVVTLPSLRISGSLARSAALPLDWARKTCPNRRISCPRSSREVNPKSAKCWVRRSATSKGRECNPNWVRRSLATAEVARTPPCSPQTTPRALPSTA